MRTINLKVAAIFLGAVIVMAGGTYLLHGFQLSHHSHSFKALAHAAWNDKPRREMDAIQCMMAYLTLEPKDYAASKDLGFWMAETGRFSAAAAKLEELLRTMEKQNPPDKQAILEVRQKLVQLSMAMGRCSDAEAHLKVLLQDAPDDSQIDDEGASMLKLLGKCQNSLGKDAEAKASFERALKNPKNRGRVDIYYDLAMTLRFATHPDLDAAKKCMADMIAVKQNAESAYAHHVYGMWLAELEDYEGALREAKLTLAIEKNHTGGLYLAGQCELNLRHFVDAEKYAQQGIKVVPDEFPMYTLLADVYVRDNHRDKAIEILKRGVDAVKGNSAKGQLLWHLANLYLDGYQNIVDAASIGAAEECIQQLHEYHFSSNRLDFLEARVLYANDDWKSAHDEFERIRATMGDFPQLMKCLDYWIGYCYLQQGNPDQALAAFGRSLSFDKYYFKAHDGIAQILTAKGQFKEAEAEYRQVIVGNPGDGDAWVSYVRAVVLRNLRSAENERDWNFVNHELARAKQVNPQEGQLDLLEAEVLLAQGRSQAAEGLLDSLHKDAPNSVEFFIGLSNLAARRGESAKARQILDEARAKLGDRFLLRLARGAMAVRELGFRAGPEIEKLADDLDAYSTDEETKLLNGLLNDLLDIKDYDRAKAICRRIGRVQPHDATVRYRLLELALVTHNFRDPAASLAELDGVLAEIEAIAGRGPLWLYGKAVRLRLEYTQDKPELLDKAMEFAQDAQRMRVSWSRPHVLMGEICRLRHDDDEALTHYLQASIIGDQDLDFIRLLLKMLFERQRYEEANQVIHRLDRNQVSVSQDILKTETDLYAIWGPFGRALECATSAYDPDSGDYNEHLWHGRVLKILARRARLEGHEDQLPKILADAEESLRKAILLAPHAAECRVELVQLLVSANAMGKARNATSDAKEMLPSEVAPLALGYMYDALGETSEAVKNYEKALQRHPDSPLAIRTLAESCLRNHDWQRAAPLIEKLLGRELATTEVDLVSARRMKAALLIDQGYSQFKQALALIDQNLASPMALPQDRRIKARLLLSDPRMARSRETLDLLEGFVNKGDAEPEPQDRFELARLYRRLGEWPACREQMEKLVNAGQCEPRFLAAYVQMLLEQDQLVDTELWLNRLEKVSKPGSSVALRADLMFRNNDWGAVTQFLTAYLDQANAVPADRTERMLIVARLFEDFGNRLTASTQRSTAQGFFDEAGKLLESYGKDRPDGEMALAAFYARRGRLGAALDLLEHFAGKADPLPLASAAVAVIDCENVTPQQLQQVEKVLTGAAAAQKEPVPLLTALGVLKITQGQPVEAEAFYRRVIAKNPKDFQADNNLAMLLALSGNKDKLDEALDLINRAIELVGPQPRLLDSRAVIRICRKEPQQALEDLESIFADKAQKIDPVWLFHKAWALSISDKPDDARDVLQKARSEEYNLDRSKIDPPERIEYDRLEKELRK